MRSAFEPLLGDRSEGFIGDVIDILAVVSTLFGVATSLGLGAMQVNAGLEHLFGISVSMGMQMIIIAVITLMATVSVVTGLKAGVRRLSELNMGLAALLLFFVFVMGPTLALCGGFVDNLIAYAKQLPRGSFGLQLQAHRHIKRGWARGRFFIGRGGSRGRLLWACLSHAFLKEERYVNFLMAVLLAPTLTGFVWFTVFGNTVLNLEQSGVGGMAKVVSENMPAAIYVLLKQF